MARIADIVEGALPAGLAPAESPHVGYCGSRTVLPTLVETSIDRGVGRPHGGSAMNRTDSRAAVASGSTCTPCRLGIHSCCSTRLRACECSADWHGDRRAGTGRRLS